MERSLIMSIGNGGIIGPDNDPTTSTQSEVITTFNSSGTLTTATHTKELQYLIIAGGGGGGGHPVAPTFTVGSRGGTSSIAGVPITTVDTVGGGGGKTGAFSPSPSEGDGGSGGGGGRSPVGLGTANQGLEEVVQEQTQ